MSRLKYSRLVIARKAKDDAVIGLLSLHSPLGLLEQGRDLIVCFREAGNAREAKLLLESRGFRAELVTDIPEEDPLEAFRAASRPFPVGRRFWIDPGDPSDSEPPVGRIALRLPASRAFGTGGHESTRLLLLVLEEESVVGYDVLDVGTGSGVLALAAAALGARRVIGCDIDWEAILVASENRKRHVFGDRVRLMTGTADAIRGVFPLVLANLLPEEFLSMKRRILDRVAPKGRLILSGIPEARERDLLERLRSRRWFLAGRRCENGWTCVCLKRT